MMRSVTAKIAPVEGRTVAGFVPYYGILWHTIELCDYRSTTTLEKDDRSAGGAEGWWGVKRSRTDNRLMSPPSHSHTGWRVQIVRQQAKTARQSTPEYFRALFIVPPCVYPRAKSQSLEPPRR